MNNGKICVSVCAETVDEMIANIKRAEKLGEIVELRFDCLSKSEFNCEDIEASEEVHCRIQTHETLDSLWISTFRVKGQGGTRELSEIERTNFWHSGFETDLGDFEEDMVKDSLNWLWDTRICSYHDFSGEPFDVNEVFERLDKTGADVIKIAIFANDITDAIPVWRLLETGNVRSKAIIPVAMGEAGKWTRILGLAHGAYLTYAALESGSETAPGQILAADLRDLYRVRELDEKTAVYGVIGGDTSYSNSPLLHNTAFKSARLNAVFVPLQVRDLDDFMRRMVMPDTREVELNFHGFAVTNPHKQAIIKYLDFVDETAQKIGAVNTVKIENGMFYGYNTDAAGFIGPLKKQFGNLIGARVALVGAGGAARGCIYALLAEGADVNVFARDEGKARLIADEFGVRWSLISNFGDEKSNNNDQESNAGDQRSKIKDQRSNLSDKKSNNLFSGFDIIVNSTPLGTKGEFEDQTIAVAEQLRGVKLVYDLVYNPMETLLLREAKAAGVAIIGGIEMLIAQGASQFEIWTGQRPPIRTIKEAVLSKFTDI